MKCFPFRKTKSILLQMMSKKALSFFIIDITFLSSFITSTLVETGRCLSKFRQLQLSLSTHLMMVVAALVHTLLVSTIVVLVAPYSLRLTGIFSGGAVDFLEPFSVCWGQLLRVDVGGLRPLPAAALALPDTFLVGQVASQSMRQLPTNSCPWSGTCTEAAIARPSSRPAVAANGN